MKETVILAINPGSTSTKVALFEGYDNVFSLTLSHAAEELKNFATVSGQLDYRSDIVENAVTEKGYALDTIDVFVGRGGGLVPVECGTYEVSDLLLRDATIGTTGQHPAQLGSQMARRFADRYGKRAYVVTPPDVDELCDVARVTGLKGVYRESHTHALNQKAVALRFCRSRGLTYEAVNLIICHLGGGISVTAHEKGRMIDSNDIIKGSGPMAPTRAGDIPYIKIIDLAYSGEYSKDELIDKLNKNGGLTDHFNTADVRDIIDLIDDGNKYAEVIMGGMLYQVSKYIGAMAVAMRGDVNAIILTGGVTHRKYITDRIAEYVEWIAEVDVMPGEYELEALAAGALRVIKGEEKAKVYTGQPVWNGFV